MSLAATRGLSYDATVAGWTDHLRSGGTTTWSAWLDDPRTGVPPQPLPDAVHLELVRRINLAAGERSAAALVDRVLATASPGRGLVDVPLPWPSAPRRFGSPAIDPGQLPEDELIRLATGVIVHLLPGLPPPAVTPERARWPVPWRRRFRLHGTPGTMAAVRRGLLDQGLVESDWRPTHVVLARSVEAMMAERWAANTRSGGILKWSTTWRRARVAGRLPAEIDVSTIASRLEGRRREPVHVVVARDAQEAAEQTARVLGARPYLATGGDVLAATDLMRRVNRLAGVVEGPARVRDLAASLAAVLDDAAAGTGPAPDPVVPRAASAWARERAQVAAHELRKAGYPVHGNLDELVPADHPRSGPRSGSVDRHRTLELAVAACLQIWRLQGGTP